MVGELVAFAGIGNGVTDIYIYIYIFMYIYLFIY